MGACGSEEPGHNVELPQQPQSGEEKEDPLDKRTNLLLTDHYKKRIAVLQQRNKALESECERQRKRACEAEQAAKRAATEKKSTWQ